MHPKNQSKSYDDVYRAVEPIVSAADPAALGGAFGEYESQINEIVKLILEEKVPMDGETLRQIFVRGFPDCDLNTSEQFSRMAEEILNAY